jgi:hypothetical protein
MDVQYAAPVRLAVGCCIPPSCAEDEWQRSDVVGLAGVCWSEVLSWLCRCCCGVWLGGVVVGRRQMAPTWARDCCILLSNARQRKMG